MKEAQQTLDLDTKEEALDEATWLLNQAARLENQSYILTNQGQILIFQVHIWKPIQKAIGWPLFLNQECFPEPMKVCERHWILFVGDYQLATLRF